MSTDKKDSQTTLDDTLDWEYMSDFYVNESRPVKSLEEYMLADEEPSGESIEELADDSDDLAKVVEDVKKVREYMTTGKTVIEIANELQMDTDYINTIAITLCNNSEDSGDIALPNTNDAKGGTEKDRESLSTPSTAYFLFNLLKGRIFCCG